MPIYLLTSPGRQETRMPQKKRRNPVPTVDVIIEVGSRSPRGIVLIRRKNPPFGWALPGGFVGYGESLEEAALREAKEETSLDVRLGGQLHTYSDPGRDPRLHTISTVFIARASGKPLAADDAREARVVQAGKIGVPLAFDHRKILDDYVAFKEGRFPWTGKKPRRRDRIKTRT
jgi:ADP-ribose pyrophosphatase YjhB (NUDIX family)